MGVMVKNKVARFFMDHRVHVAPVWTERSTYRKLVISFPIAGLSSKLYS